MRALEQWQVDQSTASTNFDVAFGIEPPSPDLSLKDSLCQQEEEDIQEAIRRSARKDRQAKAKAHRQAELDNLFNTTLSASPPPMAGPSTLRALSKTPELPQRLVPLPVPLQITKQLHNDWLGLSPLPPTFNISARGGRRALGDPQLLRRFTLVYISDVRPFPRP